jgi:hypothetical protein
MELREMNYLKRKGKPIPKELLNKPFEDFDVSNQIKTKRRQSKMSKISIEEEKMDEIKEDKKESSELSNTPKSSIYDKTIENKKSKKSSEKENGILQLKFCEDDEDEKSDNKEDNNDE